MITVHRQNVEVAQTGYFDFNVPQGAELMGVQFTGTHLSVYYLCDPDGPEEARRLLILTAGEPVDDNMMNVRYLNTLVPQKGSPMHFFEVQLPPHTSPHDGPSADEAAPQPQAQEA